MLWRAVRAVELPRNLQVRSCKPDPLAADIVHVREDRGDGAGAGFARRLGCPDFMVKMFDKKLVDAIIGGEGLGCDLTELSVNFGWKWGHGALILDPIILLGRANFRTNGDLPVKVPCLFDTKLIMVPAMLRPSSILSLLFLCMAGFAVAQAPPSAKPVVPSTDHSQEAFVIEQFYRRQRFENDGKSSQEDTARVRIQSQSGVQTYGILSFSYPSATGTFEIGYVRVRKPDGSVVETPPENVQDMAAEITRQAPFYRADRAGAD